MKIGSYRLLRKIGEGGMGAVYEALHETIGQRLAAKVLHAHISADEEAMKRFTSEAIAASRVQHPGMVKVFDSGTLPDGTSFLMMELLEGESLAARLSRLNKGGQRLPLDSALDLTRQIASALAAAHKVGIVHRDLKPDNVYITADPVSPTGERAKILDFGIAKFLVDSPEKKKTAVGLILGTPTYMSPEQCEGKEELDPRTDVYSLGVILFEMIAGQPPFEAQMASSLMRQHMFKDPPALRELAPEVPADIGVLVHEMLAKSADGRPTMEQVLPRLGARPPSSAYPVQGPSPTPTPTPTALGARNRTLIIGAVAAAVALCGVGIYLALGLDSGHGPTAVVTGTPAAPGNAKGARPTAGQEPAEPAAATDDPQPGTHAAGPAPGEETHQAAGRQGTEAQKGHHHRNGKKPSEPPATAQVAPVAAPVVAPPVATPTPAQQKPTEKKGKEIEILR